jgi:hypothetical protein
MKVWVLCGTLAAAGLAGSDEVEDAARRRAAAEEKVKADLARRLQAAPEAVAVVETAERTWPDERLGCWSRRVVADPLPVPGYRIVLQLGDRRFVYHTDRAGGFVPCDRPVKPIDPIR